MGGDFTLAGCPGCGLIFYDADLIEESLAAYYSGDNHYAAAATPGVGGDSPLDKRHQDDIVGRLAPWLGGLPLSAPLMEVGCGRGGLLKALRNKGFENLYGVEPQPGAAASARSEGFKVAPGRAEELPWPEIAPSLIIYSHVLEHLPRPGAALDLARERLAEGGLIYLEVPDAEHFGRDGAPFQELYFEHLSHFSQKSLAALISGRGFKPLALAQADFHLPRGRVEKVLWAVAEKSRGEESIEPLNVPGEAEKIFSAFGAYLAWSTGHPALKTLAALAESQKPVWVWGLSQLTLLLMRQSPLANCRLAGFIDKDPAKIGRRLLGRQISPPANLAGRPADEIILLAAWGYEEAMLRELNELGLGGQALKLFP